jgi:hypothetical protein
VTFLSPLFLLGAATAAIPIVLHFLHREPEARVKFAAVHLLRHAPVEDTRKRRLREWLLLALRVAALLLLALAFARPFVVSGAASTVSGVTVVALDTSLSMSPRFGQARQLAKDAIARTPSGELVGVVTFDDRARNASMPSTDRALAIAAVDAAAPGFGATRYSAAIGAAAQMIASVQGRNQTIVVVSDLQASGWDAGDHVGVSDTTRVQVADVGPAPDNMAITGARVQLDHVVATVRNAGKTMRDAHVQLSVDGRHVSDSVVPFAAGASADVVLAGARGETAQVSVDDPSGSPADNIRYLILDNTGQPTVLIVTTNGDLGRDAFYAEQAALATGTAEPGFRVVGAAGADLGAWAPDRFASVAAVMLTSTTGLDARGRLLLSNYVHAGGGIFIAAGPEVAGDVVAEILGGAVTIQQGVANQAPGDRVRRFAPTDLRHPVFQVFENGAGNLGLVAFNRIVSLSGKSCATLANFTTGEAALLDCALGEGRVLVLASDIDNRWNDFPRRPTFVPLMQESLRYLAGSRERASDLLVGNVPAGIEAKPGVIALPGGGTANRARKVAVNVDPREADPDRVTPEEFQAAVTRLKAAGREDARLADSQLENRQHLWEYALLASLALLAAESVVSMRAA